MPFVKQIEVYCDTLIEVFESRDVKGLYKKSRSRKIAEFSGISSPYEVPEVPELVMNTGGAKIEVRAAGYQSNDAVGYCLA